MILEPRPQAAATDHTAHDRARDLDPCSLQPGGGSVGSSGTPDAKAAQQGVLQAHCFLAIGSGLWLQDVPLIVENLLCRAKQLVDFRAPSEKVEEILDHVAALREGRG